MLLRKEASSFYTSCSFSMFCTWRFYRFFFKFFPLVKFKNISDTQHQRAITCASDSIFPPSNKLLKKSVSISSFMFRLFLFTKFSRHASTAWMTSFLKNLHIFHHCLTSACFLVSVEQSSQLIWTIWNHHF